MTFQSSFLIRCWLGHEAGVTQVKTYFIEHVQTGQQLRSASLTDVNEWIVSTNGRYIGGLIAEGGPAMSASLQTQQWSQLLDRISQGRDESALAELYRQSCPTVYGALWRILRNNWNAEEAMQDVYQQVWLQAASYRPDKGTPAAWLVTIARSRALDRIRRERKHSASGELEESTLRSFGATPEPGINRRLLMNDALLSLAPPQRRLIELAFFDGRSHQEIADLTGVPLGTIKTRIRTTLLQLREIVA